VAVTDSLIDTLFDGRYRIVRKLGSGGMANVYLAEDQELGRRVAIKILNDRHAGDEQFVERFRREAKNAAGLSHANIVSIYDRGEAAEGTYYIAMEYLDGRSLKELIVSRGPAPIPIAIDYTRQILAALRFAHRNGVIHRDIKPHNILVDSEGRVKVTDFGIARAEQAGASAQQMTEAGSIIGTAQYLSPEQARGTRVDATSDLYSLGIVLYELLTGTVPFSGETPVEIAMKHLSAIPDPPSERRQDVPHALDMVVLRALAKDPRDRYQSAEEMDADLERVARGSSVSRETEEAATTVLSGAELAAAAPTTIQRAPTAVTQLRPAGYYDYEEPARRRAFWPWLLALLLVAAAAVAAVYVYNQIQDELNANKPIAVELYVGLQEKQAVENIQADGFKPDVKRLPNTKQPQGVVYDQDPDAGQRQDKGNFVTIWVSTGPPKTTVPNVKGLSRDEAVSRLASAHLQANVHEVPSTEQPDVVLAQDPKAGQKVNQNAKVRINVSSGPRPVSVPNVVGQAYDSAASMLQGQGFAVAKKLVDSDQPAGVVVDSDPKPGSSVAPGSSITLLVSKGPKEQQVPSVENLDVDTAKGILQDSGFKWKIVFQDTTDGSLDGVVITQNPAAATKAPPGTVVTLTVGRLVQETTPTAPTTP
jgi:beta-lactam-binding protein with PASTA domain/predicted Ser/Thr protein kinase